MMFDLKNARELSKVLACAGASAFVLSACISVDTNSNTTAVTPQGTVDLDKVRAGVPETVFKQARITFAVDTHPEASAGGKTQYLSRTYNAKHGQYVAQCKDDRCYELQVIYDPPVPRADGLATMAQILPPDAPAETSVDDTVLKSPKNPRALDIHYFGNKYLGIITYADKTGSQVKMVNVYAMPPEAAFVAEYGKIPPALKIPAASRTSAVATETKTGTAATDTAEH